MKVARAKQVLEKAAAAFGGHVEDDSTNDVCLQVCAPEGKQWVESGGPHLVVATARGLQAWLDDAVRDGLERIASGIEDAEEEE